MNKELQRIRIAEACGWYEIHHYGTEHNGPESDVCPPRLVGKRGQRGVGSWAVICSVPKYVNDLNAMHEAEQYLHKKNPTQYWFYADVLLKDVVWKNGAPGIAYQCATAAQRAEAFLRAVSKWEGAPL